MFNLHLRLATRCAAGTAGWCGSANRDEEKELGTFPDVFPDDAAAARCASSGRFIPFMG